MGFGVIYHMHNLSLQNIAELNELQDRRLSRPVTLPEGLKNDIKKSYISREDVHLC